MFMFTFFVSLFLKSFFFANSAVLELEPDHQMQFCVIPKIPIIGGNRSI